VNDETYTLLINSLNGKFEELQENFYKRLHQDPLDKMNPPQEALICWAKGISIDFDIKVEPKEVLEAYRKLYASMFIENVSIVELFFYNIEDKMWYYILEDINICRSIFNRIIQMRQSEKAEADEVIYL
jgi:hypothetical protein